MRLFTVNDNTIGERLKTLRRAADISQGDLALAVGTSQQTITSIEKDKSQRSTFLPAIAEHLGTTYQYLATGQGAVVVQTDEPELLKMDDIQSDVEFFFDSVMFGLKSAIAGQVIKPGVNVDLDDVVLTSLGKYADYKKWNPTIVAMQTNQIMNRKDNKEKVG
jgi:transcriptional regulator with XRE-family HTH domain